VISGSGGIAGIILALSGICLPCVLIPLGFIGAGLLFFFSFISKYRWWLIGLSVFSLLLALSAKRVTVCKDGVCRIDRKKTEKITFALANLKENLKKLNNWRTYALIPVILIFVGLLFILSLSGKKPNAIPPVPTEEVKQVQKFPEQPPRLTETALPGKTTATEKSEKKGNAVSPASAERIKTAENTTVANTAGQAEPVKQEAKSQKPDLYARFIGTAPQIGPSDAKVTLIEYSDYFCPHCLTLYEDIIQPLLKKYDGKIRFASVQVNILMNMGYSSTHAAYCAEDQGKYWEMHSKLIKIVQPFVDQPKSVTMLNKMKQKAAETDSKFLTKMAGTIKGLDTAEFSKCMESDKYYDRIRTTTENFEKLGFNWVPVLLINGQYFPYNPTLEGLSEAIDSML